MKKNISSSVCLSQLVHITLKAPLFIHYSNFIMGFEKNIYRRPNIFRVLAKSVFDQDICSSIYYIVLF